MMNIASMTKIKRKQYILGELAASAKPTQSNAFIRGVTVSYRVLGKSVCRDVCDTRMSYLEHSISDFITQAKIPPWRAVDVSPAME